jgi:cytochrome c
VIRAARSGGAPAAASQRDGDRPPPRSWRATRIGVVLALLGMAGCRGAGTDRSYPVSTGGDRSRGLATIDRAGCGACHDIPGVRSLHGRLAPSLADFAHRAVIAGILPNSPANLTRWLIDPPSISPRTAMPVLGLTDQEARDVAAYLYHLD